MLKSAGMEMPERRLSVERERERERERESCLLPVAVAQTTCQPQNPFLDFIFHLSSSPCHCWGCHTNLSCMHSFCPRILCRPFFLLFLTFFLPGLDLLKMPLAAAGPVLVPPQIFLSGTPHAPPNPFLYPCPEGLGIAAHARVLSHQER
jgi:hypothetical protein